MCLKAVFCCSSLACSVPVLFLFCSCSVPVLFLFLFCSVPVLFLFCSCSVPVPVPVLFCSCSVPVLFLFCSCSVPVLFLFCSVLWGCGSKSNRRRTADGRKDGRPQNVARKTTSSGFRAGLMSAHAHIHAHPKNSGTLTTEAGIGQCTQFLNSHPHTNYSNRYCINELMTAITVIGNVGLAGRRYTWTKKKTAEMVRALDESSECKNKEVHCACGALHFDQIMNGMCCDSDTSCACCSKDPTISKLPKWVRNARQVQECKDQILFELGQEQEKKEVFCKRDTYWSWDGHDDSKCCDKGYMLVVKELSELARKSQQGKVCVNENLQEFWPEQKKNAFCLWAPTKTYHGLGCCHGDAHYSSEEGKLSDFAHKPRQGQACKDHILHSLGIKEEAKKGRHFVCGRKGGRTTNQNVATRTISLYSWTNDMPIIKSASLRLHLLPFAASTGTTPFVPPVGRGFIRKCAPSSGIGSQI
uniref:Uncharacterized protein n=1 Tax=Globodera rostochiensis TaxID=31243 RepID=A0A914H9W4_GLORO